MIDMLNFQTVENPIGHPFKWPCARNTGRSGSGKNQKF